MFEVQYIYATKGIWSILFSSFTNVLKMDEKKKLYRAALLLHYRSGKSADEAHRLLLEEMKDQAPSRATCFRWYGKFDKGGKCLEDCSRSGRPLTRKKQLILAICEERPNVTVRELATSSGAPKSRYTMFFVRQVKWQSCLGFFRTLSALTTRRSVLKCALLCSAVIARFPGSTPSLPWMRSIVSTITRCAENIGSTSMNCRNHSRNIPIMTRRSCSHSGGILKARCFGNWFQLVLWSTLKDSVLSWKE